MKIRHPLVAGAALASAALFALAMLPPRVTYAQSYVYYTTQNPTYPYSTFSFPTGIIVSNLTTNGSLDFFIADTGHNRIMYWNSAQGGSPTVFAGNGTAGYVDSSSLTSAEFNAPTGLWGGTYEWLYTYGCGNGRKCQQWEVYHEIWVDDTGNQVVRLVCNGNSDGRCTDGVSTVAGNGTEGYVNGSSLSAEFAGLVGDHNPTGGGWFLFDSGNNVVRSWDGSTVGTWAGSGLEGLVNGSLGSAEFDRPADGTWDSSSNAYLTDMMNDVIRKIDSSGNVTTLAGSGAPGYADGQGGAAEFDLPTGIAYNSSDGYLYVADSANNMIRRVDTSGNVTTFAGQRAGGHVDACGASAKFATPTGVVIYNGYAYVADTMNNDIRQVNLSTGCVTTYIH